MKPTPMKSAARIPETIEIIVHVFPKCIVCIFWRKVATCFNFFKLMLMISRSHDKFCHRCKYNLTELSYSYILICNTFTKSILTKLAKITRGAFAENRWQIFSDKVTKYFKAATNKNINYLNFPAFQAISLFTRWPKERF